MYEENSSPKKGQRSKMEDESEDSDYQPSAFVLKKIDSPVKNKGNCRYLNPVHYTFALLINYIC